jgi:lipopolysaccharide transport system permease protein
VKAREAITSGAVVLICEHRFCVAHRASTEDDSVIKSATFDFPIHRHSARQRIAPPKGWLDLNLWEVWDHRELLYFLVWRDLKVRYKQTAIGALWAILQPFLTMLVFSLFFGRLAHIPSNGLPHSVFYYSALLAWIYFATALQHATNTMVENQRVITKVYFPRLLLPLASVTSGLVDLAFGFIVFLGMLVYYGIAPGRAILLMPLFLLLAVLTALGVGLWLSALNAIYRDVRYVVPFLIQFWMFASPVAYPSSLVPERWRGLYGLNPMAGVVEGFRWSLTGHGQPPSLLLVASAIMVLLLLAGGLLYFQKTEGTIADVV